MKMCLECIRKEFGDETADLVYAKAPSSMEPCQNCGLAGSATFGIVYRRLTVGEAVALEPVQIVCDVCDGDGCLASSLYPSHEVVETICPGCEGRGWTLAFLKTTEIKKG